MRVLVIWNDVRCSASKHLAHYRLNPFAPRSPRARCAVKTPANSTGSLFGPPTGTIIQPPPQSESPELSHSSRQVASGTNPGLTDSIPSG